MSWSIEVHGTKDGALREVAAQLDKIAAGYGGNEESKDILACKERILAQIAATDFRTDGGITYNGVIVKANGSHGSTGKGLYNADFTVSVIRTSLALDATT